MTAVVAMLVSVAFGTTVGASAATAPQSSTAHAAGTPVNIQMTYGNPNTFTTYVAWKEGFYRRNGVDATLVPISGSAATVAALAAGSLDVTNASPETLISDVQKGLAAEAIDSQANTDGIFQIIANNSVPHVSGSLDQKLQGFRGKTLGVSGLGSSVQFVTEEILADTGLHYPTDYNFSVVANGAPFLAALATNKIQGGLVGEPVPAELVSQNQGWVIDSLLTPTHQAPKQLTSGLPYDDIWAMDSWVATHKQAVKGMQRAIAQAYVWLHNPKHFAQAEADVLNVDGGTSIPNGELPTLTKEAITLSAAWISKSAMAPFDAFDKTYGFVPDIVPLKQLVISYGPTSEAQAMALANS